MICTGSLTVPYFLFYIRFDSKLSQASASNEMSRALRRVEIDVQYIYSTSEVIEIEECLKRRYFRSHIVLVLIHNADHKNVRAT